MAEPTWEAALERARLEEKKGRLEAAERSYRRALALNGGFGSLERELARFLEARGRTREAESRLLRALELGWPREEGERTLARLREKRSARALAAAGRFDEAAAALAEAPATEEGDALAPAVFSALLCARAYEAAFRFAEAMLRKSPQAPLCHKALWPWWHGASSRGSAEKDAFCAAELERVRRASATGRRGGWFAYLRGVLLLNLNRNAEAMAEYALVRRLRAPRYALLRYPFVLCRLGMCDFAGAISEFRALLADAPGCWWFRCRMGEALMAAGEAAKGLAEFERAAREAPPADRPAVAAWHGGALLWAGEYRASLAKLDEALALGADLWVRCWRGGALLMLGRPARALADLDLALERDPQDLEAHLWRGEACRVLGRTGEALRALDRAVALDSSYAWAYFNRALARDDAGDAKGMAADCARIPADLLAAVRGPVRPGKGGAPGRAATRALLEEGLRRAKGVRRPEHFLNSIWMGHGEPLAPRSRA